MEKSYIIYDGACGFCNKSTLFIAKKDILNKFKFVSNLSEFGTKLLVTHQIKGLEKATIILKEKNNIYTKSVAIQKIVLQLPYYKWIGYLLFLIPKKLANFIYDFIAKHRKKIIKNTTCELPNEEIRKKFII